jgi:uncharacterized protein (TIGR03067 family)
MILLMAVLGPLSSGCFSDRLSQGANVSNHEPGKDMQMLQGAWVATLVQKNDVKLRKNGAGMCGIIFQGERAILCYGADEGRELRFSINPEVSPKTIDLFADEPESTLHGIYEINGDNLKICFSHPRRPTVLTSGNDAELYVLRRGAGNGQN